jgi:hypothetical protein
MFDHKSKLLTVLVFVLLSGALAAPVFAQTPPFAYTDYQAWVTPGQYVKYGGFEATGEGLQAYNNNDWMKYEVVEVNTTKATLLLTGQYKNGTAILGNGDKWVYDVTILNRVNGTVAGQNPIIAGNLSQGNTLASYAYVFDTVNYTENRRYLGVDRVVNILEYVVAGPSGNSTAKYTYVYDRFSGMELEIRGEVTEDGAASPTQVFSYHVTETNIFGPNSGIPASYYYVAAVVVALVVVVAVVVLKKRTRHRHRTRKR